jgi:exodeoxyribonuclease VII small subunit
MTELKLEEINELDFETAFTALEQNVSQLESEELALEEALALYERGQHLARRCADLLEAAELKMRTLSQDPEE